MPKQNSLDRRGYRGSERNRVISPEEVIIARQRYEAGEVTPRELAESFGMGVESVRRMLRGDTYGNVGKAVQRATDFADGEMEGIREGAKRLIDFQRSLGTTPPDSQMMAGQGEETTHEDAIRAFLGEGDEASEGAKKGE